MARNVWNAISITFGIRAPTSVADICGDWLRGWKKINKRQMLIGVAAVCWSIWLSRNEIVFNNTLPNSFIQVIFRGTYWTRSWAMLSKEEDRTSLKDICRKLEVTIMEIFNKFGWRSKNRLHN